MSRLIEKYEFLLDNLNYKPTNGEKELMEDVKFEEEINVEVRNIYNIANTNRMYIPFLTDMDGDCLFNSLRPYTGIDVQKLRNRLATLLRTFKSKKNYFPKIEDSLEEMFNATNDVEYVRTKNKPTKFYKYTYDIMCRDLSNLQSWTRLPVQIILLVVSHIYKYNIQIINSSGSKSSINVYEECPDVSVRKIYLGHIKEFHYVPIVPNSTDKEYPCPAYIRYHKRLEKRYANLMVEFERYMENGVYENSDDSDDSGYSQGSDNISSPEYDPEEIYESDEIE